MSDVDLLASPFKVQIFYQDRPGERERFMERVECAVRFFSQNRFLTVSTPTRIVVYCESLHIATEFGNALKHL